MRQVNWRFAIAALVFLGASCAGAPDFVLSASGPVPGHYTLAALLPDGTGITAGMMGQMYRTDDGGAHWTRADNGASCRLGLELVSANLAFSCGNYGYNEVTTDGGRSWSRLADFGPNEPDHCRFLSFCDSGHGLIATPLLIARTRDAGASWQEFALPEGSGTILAVHVLSPDLAYVLVSTGAVLETNVVGIEDAARAEWVSIGTPMRDLMASQLEEAVCAVRFQSDSYGTVVYRTTNPSGAWIVLTTRNRGRNWSEQTILSALGGIWLSRDATLLTISHEARALDVYRREG